MLNKQIVAGFAGLPPLLNLIVIILSVNKFVAQLSSLLIPRLLNKP